MEQGVSVSGLKADPLAARGIWGLGELRWGSAPGISWAEAKMPRALRCTGQSHTMQHCSVIFECPIRYNRETPACTLMEPGISSYSKLFLYNLYSFKLV